MKAEQSSQKRRTLVATSTGYEQISFPGHFPARTVPHHGKDLRHHQDILFCDQRARGTAHEFIRLIKLTHSNGVILDVRANGGSNILAADPNFFVR